METTEFDVLVIGTGEGGTTAAQKYAKASNLLKGNRTLVSYGMVPTTVFSHPPLAAVGLTEAEATRQGLKFTARRLPESASAYKVLVEEGSGQVFGPNADEVINLFAVAKHAKGPARDLQKLVFAYPTSASDIVYML